MSFKRKIALAMAAVLIVSAVVYTRPMTLRQICGNIAVSESSFVYGYYNDSPHMVDDEGLK